ncbi:hypothetical protein V5799_021821 [Amblyomma americanum]|uniref:Uncharacterized protein n=1 Tax=Amblyomma americanum TaxID=6943 RepID=A0AAQ4FPM7_AMBAM
MRGKRRKSLCWSGHCCGGRGRACGMVVGAVVTWVPPETAPAHAARMPKLVKLRQRGCPLDVADEENL